MRAMRAFNRSVRYAIAALALTFGAAMAQENLDSGKSAAELYAQNCAICHKSPRGLAQTGGIMGVQAFLREHYTASREAAAAIAAYLQAVDHGPTAPGRPAKRTAAKPKEKGKPGEGAASAKGAESKAPEADQGGAKPDKPAEAKSDAKAESKPDTKAEAKTEGKPDGEKAAAKKPRAVAKPDAEKKPD